MSSLFRRYQQPLMIILTVLVIIIFVGYWNGPTGNGNRSRLPQVSDNIGKIYGNNITKTAIQREVRKAQLARNLNLGLFSSLGAPARSLQEAVDNFVWNSLVLQHEADRLQLEPMGEAVHSDPAVLEAIKNIPLFQTEDGQFDPKAYADFVANNLPSLGFDAGDLEELVAEDLRMNKIKDLLHTTFVVSPEDFRQSYTQQYQKIDTSVIHFNQADFAAKVKVSDDDVKKAFEKNVDAYHSEEKRGIKFVTFGLSDDEKKLKDKERIPALQKLSDNVQAFTQALGEPGAKFDDVAAKFKAPVTDIPPFALSAPDKNVPMFPEFMDAAFRLTKEAPVSDPVLDEQTGSYYVLQLQDIVPSKQLTLAEASPQILEQLKTSRAEEQLTEQAHEARTKLLADIAAGKSFADAAKAEGLKVEVYPPSSVADPDPEKEDAADVLSAASDLKEGDLSDFVPTATGGILVHVDKREPIDPKKYDADKVRLWPMLDKWQVNHVFSEWLRKQREAANIIVGNGNNSPTPGSQPPN